MKHVELTVVALLFGVFVLIFVWSLTSAMMVWVTERTLDIPRIKARYEGLDGAAGPYCKVIGVERAGARVAFRYLQASRRYRVVIQKVDGQRAERFVFVDADMFGDGRIWPDDGLQIDFAIVSRR